MVESYKIRRRSRWLGFLFTLFISGTVLTVLLLIILRTPIPPYPNGGGGTGDGIELNLGFSEFGSGNHPADIVPEPPKEESHTRVQPRSEKLLTQDIKDAPSIADQSLRKRKKTAHKSTVPEKKEVRKSVHRPAQVINPNALYHPHHESAEGTSRTPGDQGNLAGSLAAKAFGNGGKGGAGGGSGGGNGTGTGTSAGAGISYNLENRHFLALPQPSYPSQSQGKVVVEVTVNKEGVVTQAVAGVRGSTTLDQSLLDAARKAALQARFNRKPDAPAYQKGTITYSFRLQ